MKKCSRIVIIHRWIKLCCEDPLLLQPEGWNSRSPQQTIKSELYIKLFKIADYKFKLDFLR